ncbi:hypothetical protein CN230_10935 [Sinorhizobium meliloti]|nr:hypothetical protein CN230_10935 [Sinorhizobium meliloti]RVG30817.1 hypothetical protein CN225_22215 [Sinorhizobium meliloti]RVG51485.1 hypothetical protein CN224_27490 [Sinorhizobium meliloti]RVL95436.1 hypothetical protein CN131_06330 [Sinorhizobium meliloti]
MALAVTRPSSACRHLLPVLTGRRDKRRRLNPAFTVRPRERAGAAYPFSPPAGRRWRQPVEGQSRPSGVEAVGFPRDPFHEQYPPHRRGRDMCMP